jgi:hypothetical protein
MGGGEQEGVEARPGVTGKVALDDRKEMGWDRHVPDAGGGLRWSHHRMPVHPGDASADAYLAVDQVGVSSPQLGDLALTHRAPRL